MAEVAGLLGRDALAQLPLHLEGVLGTVGNAQTAGDADAVGVADVALLTEDVAQDKVGGLAAHTGEGSQLLHRSGNLAAVLFQKLLGAGHQVPGLAVEKAAGVDVLAHLLRVGLREALQGGKALKQGGGYLVYPLVGALGGEAHGEQQLIVLFVLQRAQGVGIDALQCFDNALDGGFGTHGHHLLPTGYHKFRQKARKKTW